MAWAWNHNSETYTSDEVLEVFQGPVRQWDFRFELLDENNETKTSELLGVLSASVENNALARIKRTARLQIRSGLDSIDFLKDRIRPWVRLRMPDGGYQEWPLGVFLLASPKRQSTTSGGITRDVEAYDQLLVYQDDRADDRYTVEAGTNYIDAVQELLGSQVVASGNITPTDKTLPTDRDWEPGTSKLAIINELLSSVNYESLFFDGQGSAVVRPYQSPQDRPSIYTYTDDEHSVIFPEMEQTKDIFSIPNKWVLVVSEANRDPLTATYTNASPSSPTSTVNRARTIVDYRDQEEAADQETLDAKAERLAFESSQIFEAVTFTTGIMPIHDNNEVIRLQFDPLGISHKFSEVSWSLELRHGAQMKHKIRRMVSV